MLSADNHFIPLKKSTEHNPAYKSPYFTSVRRNPNPKNKAQPHNALSITKYNKVTFVAGSTPDPAPKKKVFKRFSKFQQIDEVYPSTSILEPPSSNPSTIAYEPKQVRSRSHAREVVVSSKTLAVVDKYASYTSIMLSTPKVERNRSKNFRMKSKSGNSLHIGARELVVGTEVLVGGKVGGNVDNEDWLCRELIRNEVYGTEEDDF